MHRMTAALLVACATHVATGELKNGRLEGVPGTIPSGWGVYVGAPVLDPAEKRSGASTVKLVSSGPNGGAGLVQILEYDKPDIRPIVIGGWSKCQNVSGGGDYAIYLDIFYEDDTPWWNRTATWRRGTHGWTYTAEVFWPQKPVKRIEVYVFLRRCTGTAWVDNVFLARGGLHVTEISLQRDFPRRRDAARLKAQLTGKAHWRALVRDEQGTIFGEATGDGTAVDCAVTLPGNVSQVLLAISAEDAKGETTTFEDLLAIPSIPVNPVTSGCALWTATGLEKVLPDALPPAESAEARIRLELARGEHEGAQILLKPADSAPLRNLRIAAGVVTDATGQATEAITITPLVVGYVRLGESGGHPAFGAKTGWFPDPLLPARPIDVTEGRTQAFWLDVHARREAVPGIYRARITLTPENAPTLVVEVNIRVRQFTLPRTPRMKTAFCIMDGFTRNTYGHLGETLRRRSLDIMLDHRLNPDDISRYDPPRIQDLLHARKRGLNAFNILNIVPRPKNDPLWICRLGKDAYGEGFVEDFLERVRPVVRELRKHGLSDRAYFYGFDERREDYDEIIRSICGALKREFPEIRTFTTATYIFGKRAKVPLDYEDHMDWYCPLTPKYDLALARRLRTVGKQVWWYVCCGPKHPYANFAAIDYPAIEGRLLGWMTYGYESDGLLYWHVNYWKSGPIADWREPYLVDWKLPCVARMSGDGLLVYPLADDRLASSIRLETIRDGSEDYDLLAAVAEKHGRKAAMGIFDRLVVSMTEYNRDPQALAAARHALFELAEQ
ncbi:MAG: DUF4091 domain-containing protein [Lentisphaeria bacterium]|nr:DUF4091 domain-containing protein [Lentisphaeria bacterium]